MKTNITELKEIKKELEEKCAAYNEAYQSENFNEAEKIDRDMRELVKQYTGIARNECFAECRKAESPMMEAIKRLTFETLRIKDVVVDDIPVRTIEPGEVYIELLKLHASTVGGIGKNKDWAYMVEKLNFLLTAQKAKNLGVDPKAVNDSYSMRKISKDFDLGKNPASNTKMLGTMTGIVSAMLGDGYKPTSHDVEFLRSVYSSKSKKALTVTCANYKRLVQYMAEICHKIVQKKSYALEYPTAK